MKRLISLCLSLIMCCGFLLSAPIQAKAATWEDINQSGVFLKQAESDSCTLCAATMLVRRVAMMDGRDNWNSITEADLKGVMDWYNIGLSWDFTYEGIRIVHGTLPSDYDSKVNKLISLIQSCPEGVIVYDEGQLNLDPFSTARMTVPFGQQEHHDRCGQTSEQQYEVIE